MKKFLIIAIGLLNSALALAIEWPDQKMSVAIPTISTTKQTVTTTQNYSLPVGLAAEYAMFLATDIALFGQFEMNLELSKQSAVFIGGGGGLLYYPVGGSNRKHGDSYLTTRSRPTLNVFTGGGVAARQYDFSAVEPEVEKGLVETRDAKDKQKGSGFGIMIVAGVEYPIGFDLLPGLRYQLVQTFGSESDPTIMVNEIWLSVGFLLN